MAQKDMDKSSSKTVPQLKEDIQEDEVDDEMEFPFDLSDWMVIDADDDNEDEKDNRSSKTSNSDHQKGSPHTPQSKTTEVSRNRKHTENRKDLSSRKSPPKKQTSAKKRAPARPSSSKEDVSKYRSASTSSKKDHDQDGEKHFKQASVNQRPGTRSQISSSEKVMSSGQIQKGAKPKGNSQSVSNVKTSDPKVTKQTGKFSTTKENSKAVLQKSSLTASKPANSNNQVSDLPGSKSASETVSQKKTSSNSKNITDGNDSSLLKDKCESKADSPSISSSPMPVSTSVVVSNADSKSTPSTKSFALPSCTVSFTKFGNEETSSDISVLSTAQLKSKTKSTPPVSVSNQEQDKTGNKLSSKQSLAGSSKSEQLSSDEKTDNQRDNSSSKNLNSQKSCVQEVKSTLQNKMKAEPDINKRLSQRETRASEDSDLTGGIAEIMEAGNLDDVFHQDIQDTGDIQMSDIDSDDSDEGQKIPQTKILEKETTTPPPKQTTSPQKQTTAPPQKQTTSHPQKPITTFQKQAMTPHNSAIPYNGPVPKKRPLHSAGESMNKKAKYEETDLPGSKVPINKQYDKSKTTQGDGKQLINRKENAKRIVRRFHRTTQTIPKSFCNKLLQCSIGQPPSKTPSVKCNSSGIQCQIGEKFDDISRLLKLNLTPVNNTIKQVIFKAALAFDVSSLNPDIICSGVGEFKYGIRIGHITQSDVQKSLLKDNFIKKADRYSLSFLANDFGIFDLFFYGEENFISVFNQIRKIRIGPRYLCVTVVKIMDEEDKDSHNFSDHLKASMILDQNSNSTGYFSYYKAPIWNKPKVDEFITVHNVPEGIPLSFLGLILPDAITVLMRDVNLKFTRKGSGVRLGMSRKNGGSNVILNLYTQLLINNTPVFLCQGLTERKGAPEMNSSYMIMAEFEKLEREKHKEKMCLRTLKAVARDINENKKNAADGSKLNISTKQDKFPKKDKRCAETEQDANSDLSDISELSFSMDSIREEQKPVKARVQKNPSLKKVEPKKSLSMTMGNKLLNRARTTVHQSQTKQSGQSRLNDVRYRRSPERRRSPPVRTRENSPGRRGPLPEHSRNMRERDHRSRDRSDHRRPDDSQRREFPRGRHIREDRFGDRSSEASSSRPGDRNQRDSESDRFRHERRSPDLGSRYRPRNSSPSRDMSGGRHLNKSRRSVSRDRHDGGERSRTREGDNFISELDYGTKSVHRRNSLDRQVSLDRPNQLADINRSSEDLRNILDSRRPRQERENPTRHDSADRIRDISPRRIRRSDSRERRKRPITRSPGPFDRKVIIGRRSLSPKNRSRTGRSDVTTPPRYSPQSARPGRDTMDRGAFDRRDHGPRNVQPDPELWQSGDQQPQGQEKTEENRMTISKSLFVKLLTNVLHSEEDGTGNTHQSTPSPSDKSFLPHSRNNETSQMLSAIRNQTQDNRGNNPISFENIKGSSYGRSELSPATDNFQQGGLDRFDPKPIPPPVMPPILTSTSMTFQSNSMDSQGDNGLPPSSSAPPISQGIWALPPPGPYTMMSDRSTMPQLHSSKPAQQPPPHHPSQPPPQIQNPFNMFSRPPLNMPPPQVLPPAQGALPPNIPQALPPPRPGMWPPNPNPGFF